MTGNPSKALDLLGWQWTTTVNHLVGEMMNADLALASSMKTCLD